jgi:hypothetical protein
MSSNHERGGEDARDRQLPGALRDAATQLNRSSEGWRTLRRMPRGKAESGTQLALRLAHSA